MTRTTTLICPKCGRSSDEVRFMNAFCMDCYPFNIQTPKETVIDRCKRCRLMKLKGEWMQYDERKLGEYLIGRCRGEFAEATYDLARQTAEFTIVHGGDTVKIERRVPLETLIDVPLDHCYPDLFTHHGIFETPGTVSEGKKQGNSGTEQGPDGQGRSRRWEEEESEGSIDQQDEEREAVNTG